VIIKPYTSGTMGVPWRKQMEEDFKQKVRSTVAKKWAADNIPENYVRPRHEIEELCGSVDWLHPRAPLPSSDESGAKRVGFYIPRNLHLIRNCDFVLSVIYPGSTPVDSAHEVGFAYAVGKPVITVDLTRSPDYAAWRAMSLLTLDTMEEAVEYIFYQVYTDSWTEEQKLYSAVAAVGTKLNHLGPHDTLIDANRMVRHGNGYTHSVSEPHGEYCPES
jgi:nucleoside 2-deoxyribosyltransferase